MANVYGALSTRFKPFSFDEMIKPLLLAQEAYDKAEEDFTNLNLLVGDATSKLTDDAKDKPLKDSVIKFQNDFNKAYDKLSTQGLNSQTMRELAQLKARYARELKPIDDAYKAFKEDQKYISRMAVEHPEILIEGVGSSVSDYIDGKYPSIRSVNTDDLMAEALNIAKTQAARTYRESDWTSTAGGRFLERRIETGLKDVDFNNALSLAMSGKKYTAKDLGISEEEFNTLYNNSILIKNSINDIINTPSFKGLSPENQAKAMNSIIKGVRAGFGYNSKVDTNADPMFSHNLALLRQQIKDSNNNKKEDGDSTSNRIGSSIYRATDLGKQLVDKYLDKGKIGKVSLNDKYSKFFNSARPDGKLISRDYIERNNKEIDDKRTQYYLDYSNFVDGGIDSFTGTKENLKTPYNLKLYDELTQDIIKAGLNPNTATREEIIKRFNDIESLPDAFGRKRASIVTTDNELIQLYIEGKLGNDELKEIEGFRKDDFGIFRYGVKDKGVNINDLMVDGKLKILSVDMDYTTGERTFTVKDKDGKVREFLFPENTSFEAEDQDDLDRITTDIRTLSDIDPNTPFAENPSITVGDYLDMLQNEADSIFASILNNMGKLNINK